MKYISSVFINKASIFAISIIIIIFYLVCYKFSYNFFYQDDFHLLRFVTVFSDDSINLQQKLKSLYDLHNEHRIIFPRLFVLIDFYIQGYLDWRVLNFVSAFYYLGIFTFFALIIKRINLSYWYVLPVALFIFQPSSYENFYWTISILQQVGNLFWAMFLFYSLVYFRPKNFWISIVLIVVLSFTHGNGLFAFGVGGILLFLQKRYKHLIIWLTLMVIVATFYFHDYQTAQNSNVLGSLSDPKRLIGCFGGFWGGFIYDIYKNNSGVFITILGGLLIFLCLFILNLNLIFSHFFKKTKLKFQRYFPQDNLFLFGFFLYLSITAGLVALSRSWSSIEAGFQNRYLHNSVIALVLLYVTILHYKSARLRHFIGIFMLLGGVMFNIFSWYFNYEFILFQQKSQEADAINYQINKISVMNDKSFNQNISKILRQSFDKGISVLPKSKLLEPINKIAALKTNHPNNIPINIHKDSLLEFNISNLHFRDIYEFNNFTLPYGGDVYITLKSKNNIFINPTNHRRNSKIAFLKSGQFFTDGFMTTIMTDAMPKNTYEVGILQNFKNRFIFLPTRYKIQTR